MEVKTYDALEDKLIVKTVYDPTETLEQNAHDRANGPVTIGSKGQRMELACRVDMDHIVALKNKGYDLLSPDPAEFRRALVYIQSEEAKWMTTDKKVFSTRKQKWA